MDVDGQEDYNLVKRPDGVLDRRFDGYLPDDPEHLAQDSILPMKLYCINKECKKYGNTSLGSCFLIEELNKDERYLYFATAAHILYCADCENYRWVKPILKWAAGQHQAHSFLLGASDLGVSERGFYGWMKVSDGYTKRISDKKFDNPKECYPFDYGILAVKIAGIDNARGYANKVRRLGMFVSPPERHEFVELAYLCGYPGEVCNKDEKVPPQGAPANGDDLQYMGPTKLEDGNYKWKVQGGRFWMPSGQSRPGQESTGAEKPSERYKTERPTAALYALPQMHQEVVCDKQNSAESKARLYRHYIDTSQGQSGSPVYVFKVDGGQCVAVGIHVGLWEDGKDKDEVKRMGFNVAVRLHGHVLSEMERWVSDPSNKATDQSKPDVDTRKDTEHFGMAELWQQPTFFESSMAEPEGAAQARHDVELRLKDPWEQTAYKSSYPYLVSKMDPFTVGPQSFAMNLISSSQKNPLTRLQESPTKHNQKLLECVEKLDRKGFAKFREILRFSNSTNALDAYIKKLDTIGPDPMEKVWFELRKEFSKGGS